MIPFQDWFAYAVQALRLSPEEFWSMTLAEWGALAAPPPAAALGRDGLDRLLALYPDDLS